LPKSTIDCTDRRQKLKNSLRCLCNTWLKMNHNRKVPKCDFIILCFIWNMLYQHECLENLTIYLINAHSKPYVGVSNFFFGGGDQLPIPTRYKISVWGAGTSPPHGKFLAWVASPPCPRVLETFYSWKIYVDSYMT